MCVYIYEFGEVCGDAVEVEGDGHMYGFNEASSTSTSSVLLAAEFRHMHNALAKLQRQKKHLYDVIRDNIDDPRVASGRRASAPGPQQRRHRGGGRGALHQLLRCQYLYFCTGTQALLYQ